MFETIAGLQVWVPYIFQGFAGVPEAHVYNLCDQIAAQRAEVRLERQLRAKREAVHGRHQATALRAQDDPKNDYVIIEGATSIGLFRVTQGARIIMHTPTGTFYTGPWCKDVRFVGKDVA